MRVVFSHGVGSQAIEKLLFFPLSRTSSDPFVRNFFEKKAYDEHLLDGNALQSSALLTGLLAEEDCAMCLFYFAGIPLNNSSFQWLKESEKEWLFHTLFLYSLVLTFLLYALFFYPTQKQIGRRIDDQEKEGFNKNLAMRDLLNPQAQIFGAEYNPKAPQRLKYSQSRRAWEARTRRLALLVVVEKKG
ncbi:hypothetical protein ACJX0J_003373 (mitochondrion) [Zea mays]